MANRRMLLLGVIVGTVLAMGSREAQGAEWSAEPSLSVKGEYNSNLLLTPQSPTEVWGYWVSPGVKFAGSTENMTVSGRAAADFVGYQGDRDTSFTNLFLPLSAGYRLEKNLFKFNGGLTRDNTLRSELQQTGVVVAFTQRNLWSASPSWTYNLTERASLETGYQFAHATYEEGLRYGLVDYDSHSGNVGLSYRLLERTRVSFAGIASRFDAPGANIETQTYGVQLSATHDFSDTLRLDAAAGPRVVRNAVEGSTGTLKDDQVVWVFNGSLRKDFERTTFAVNAGREINPSGFGLLIQTDRFGVTIEHRLTENLTASLFGQLLLASGIATVGINRPFPDNRFSSVQPKLSWRMDDWWTADLWYVYGRRELEGFSDPGVSHAATFGVTYTPPRYSVGW